MLHILLIILKWIGIFIIAILCLLFLLVFSILCMPVCYCVETKKNLEKNRSKVTVYWLFHLVHFRFIYENNKNNFELYILGIPVRRWKKRFGKIKRSPKAASENQISRTKKEKSFSKQELHKEKEQIERQEVEQKHIVLKQKEEKTKSNTGIGKKIRDRIDKIQKQIRKIRLTIYSIYANIKKWNDFLTHENTKAALVFGLGKGKQLFMHIFPNKVKGDLSIGFDDPALTGQFLAIAGLFYPVFQGQLSITPFFQEQILEWDVKMKGRIFGGYILWVILRILFDKNVKVTVKRFRQKEA